MASSIPPWSQLPRELLGLVIDRLESPPGDQSRFYAFWSKAPQLRPFHAARFRAVLRAGQLAYADRARFRAVCRSWCEHLTTPWQLPWIVTSDCSFMAPSDGASPSCSTCLRLPSLPKNARCIGSTDSWIAFDCIDNVNKRITYFLHNPFSNTTVPLPELDAVIGDVVSELFEVRKVLLRSNAHDDVIALMTNDWNYPIILVRPGKGVWLPEPQAAPFVDIIDIAFLGEKLYGITQAEDLVSLDIAFNDNNGAPNVTSFCAWSDVDEDDHNNHEAGNNDVNNNDHYHEKVPIEEEEDNTRTTREVTAKTGDDMLSQGITTYWEDDEVPYEPNKDLVAVIWYLVESCGKLFMVKRQLQCPSYGTAFTCRVAVLEVNLRTCAWVPVSGGLDGQTFFISERFCKSIAAHGDIDGDTIYFADTGETFDVMSQDLSPPQRDIDHGRSMWIFSPALVV